MAVGNLKGQPLGNVGNIVWNASTGWPSRPSGLLSVTWIGPADAGFPLDMTDTDLWVQQRDRIPPDTPTLVSASTADRQSDVTWQANTEIDLDHYLLYVRDVTAGSTALLYTDPATNSTSLHGTVMTVAGLTNAHQYEFTLKAVDTSGNESPISNAVTATPAASANPNPPPSADFNGTAGDSSVTLAWTNSNDATLIRHEYAYSTDSGSTWSAWVQVTGATVASGSWSELVSGLTNGTPYLFKLRAVSTGPHYSTEIVLSNSLVPSGETDPMENWVDTLGSGVFAYYHADDVLADGTPVADGSNVTTWKDKSGNGHDLTTIVGTGFPILRTAAVCSTPANGDYNSHAAVRFSGAMRLDSGHGVGPTWSPAFGTGPMTLFLVADNDSVAAGQSLTDGKFGDGTHRLYLAVSGTTGSVGKRVFRTISGSNGPVGGTATVGVHALAIVGGPAATPTTCIFYEDNISNKVPSTFQGYPSAVGLTLGAGPSACNVAFCLLLNREATENEVSAFLSAAGAKYAI